MWTYRSILRLAMTLLLALAGTSCSSPTAGVPTPTPEQVVRAAIRGWANDPVNPNVVDTSLAYFADDAVYRLKGLPSGDQTYTGKEQIRAWWQGLLVQRFRMRADVVKSVGNEVTTRTQSWSEPTVQLGIAPLVATEVYEIRDGKIASVTWTISPESQQQLQTALATAPPATPAAAEAPLDDPGDVVGAWHITVGGASYVFALRADDSYQVTQPGSQGPIDQGTYILDGDQLQLKATAGECAPYDASTYRVSVVMKDGAPTNLRLALEGVEQCLKRKEALAGKVLARAEP